MKFSIIVVFLYTATRCIALKRQQFLLEACIEFLIFCTAPRLLHIIFVDGVNKLRKTFGGNLPLAVFEMANSFPVDEVTIGYDNHTGNNQQTTWGTTIKVFNFRLRRDRYFG